MNKVDSGMETVIRLMFRLLPVQILLCAAGSVNGVISSFFASNFVGTSAMGAFGLYGPINTLLGALSTMLSGGSAILCAKDMGKNDVRSLRKVFTANLVFSVIVGGVFTALLLAAGMFDLTGFFTQDELVRPLFNRYLIGQAIGVLPFILGNQLPVYLSMDNHQNLTMAASLAYIGINFVLDFLFVQVMHLEALGLALASSLGMWVFFLVQAWYFLRGKSQIRLQLNRIFLREWVGIVRTGLPGAAANGYQTARGIIVNKLLEAFVGSVGISAFATANNFLGFFWAVPAGMLNVSRMMIGISIGEEDVDTLKGVMRNMFLRFLPIVCGISALVILCAVPFTRLFFRDSADPVYMMTVRGIRILPLCMPLALICMHFTCYNLTVGHEGFVHLISLLDGVVCVAGFSALLVRPMGVNGVYAANVLSGIVCVLMVVAYALWKKKRFLWGIDDLLVIPDGFGVEPDARIDISVNNLDEVMTVSREAADFCKRRGIDGKKACMAGLCLEEMAGNIVEHGFTKDKKEHMIDIRVVHRKDELILRIRDDCVPFNPKERYELTGDSDRFRNVGIRMVYRIAKRVEYQGILGMNVLTVRI